MFQIPADVQTEASLSLRIVHTKARSGETNLLECVPGKQVRKSLGQLKDVTYKAIGRAGKSTRMI